MTAANSLMEIFGFKRIATINGNVIEPVFEVQCKICGDHHASDEIPCVCHTGDGV